MIHHDEPKPYLPGFEYDIFLSYGWSGNQLPDEGHRAWIAEFEKLLSEKLSGKLGQLPAIYFDARASWNGLLEDKLSQAIESSALFLFSVSPGSCRLGSWCAFEVQHFIDRARPIASVSTVMTREERMLKFVLEPVDHEAQPAAIQDVVGRRLHEDNAPTLLDNPHSGCTGELNLLVEDIARLLLTAKDVLLGMKKGAAETVFLSADSFMNHTRLRDLRRSLELNGHRTVTAALVPSESEDRFRRRTESAMRISSLSVHMLGDSSSEVPQGWTRTPAAWQVRYSLRRSRDSEEFSVYLWEDPDVRQPDVSVQTEIGSDQMLSKRDHHIKDGRGFEYLEFNLNSRLVSNTKLQQSSFTVGDEGPLMLIEAKEEDVEDAANLLVEPLRNKGFRVRFAVPTGKRINPEKRKEKNRQHYIQADRHVVYFGRATWLWAEDTCDDMREFIRDGKKGLVVIGPPPGEPPSKSRFEADDFRTIPHDALIDTPAGAL